MSVRPCITLREQGPSDPAFHRISIATRMPRLHTQFPWGFWCSGSWAAQQDISTPPSCCHHTTEKGSLDLQSPRSMSELLADRSPPVSAQPQSKRKQGGNAMSRRSCTWTQREPNHPVSQTGLGLARSTTTQARKLAVVGLALAGVLLTAPSTVFATATFMGLGYLDGGGSSSTGWDVSAAGDVVVGTSDSASGSRAFRWTALGGMEALGVLPGASSASEAHGVSDDGTVVIGGSTSTTTSEAFRWTSGGGMVGLGELPGGNHLSLAYGISGDGSAVVGYSGSSSAPSWGYEAFLWTSSTGMTGLGDLSGGSLHSEAWGVSADGSAVAGRGSGPGAQAFYWTSSGGMYGLGDLPGGATNSWAYGISDDGTTVVGGSYSNLGREAFRWTPTAGMAALGDLPGGTTDSAAYATSSDGSTVVGVGRISTGEAAFIWTQAGGLQELAQVLADGGTDLTGWSLTHAYGISSDGRSIVGVGINPSGNSEAWLATIPEPSTGILLAMGLAGLARPPRRGAAKP